jgi:hypothetical protein
MAPSMAPAVAARVPLRAVRVPQKTEKVVRTSSEIAYGSGSCGLGAIWFACDDAALESV